MYRYTPKPNRLPAFLLAAVCFFVSFALFVPYPFEAWLLIFLRGIGTGVFLVGFVILDRYAFTAFSYALEANDNVPGSVDFTVTSLRYGKSRTVCRVFVSDITEIREFSRDRLPRGQKKYNYSSGLKEKNVYIMEISDGCSATVLFTPDETMLNIIKNAINRK